MGRIVDLHIPQVHLAAVELYHAWAQVISLSQLRVCIPGMESIPIRRKPSRAGTLEGVPTIESYSFVAVNRAFAGQGDIGALGRHRLKVFGKEANVQISRGVL